jgi:pilus assembly protein Flp/PilA
MKKIFKIFKNEEGATAIEYGLIAALIAVAAIVAMGSVGSALNTTFGGVAQQLDGAVQQSPATGG